MDRFDKAFGYRDCTKCKKPIFNIVNDDNSKVCDDCKAKESANVKSNLPTVRSKTFYGQ